MASEKQRAEEYSIIEVHLFKQQRGALNNPTTHIQFFQGNTRKSAEALASTTQIHFFKAYSKEEFSATGLHNAFPLGKTATQRTQALASTP